MSNQQKEQEDLEVFVNEEEDIRRAEILKTGRSKKSKKGEREKPVYTCHYCQKDFSRSSNLKRHLTVHTGQKDYHCNLCDYSASEKAGLNKHIRSHLNERPFKCPEMNCGATFTTSSNFKSHQLVHNKSDKSSRKFSCSMCPFKSHREYCLTSHMKSIHSELKPFKCPHENCEYSAKRKRHLNSHMLIHSLEKDQVCTHPNCGFKTKTPSGLKGHMKMHSNEEKRYKCHFCEYSTHHQSSLVIHTRRHTGEKPFSCQLCPYQSSNKSHLKRHMKTHQ